MKGNRLISLSQREILGFNDEYININVTKCKKYFYFLIASFGYLINGFFVGWSSNFFTFDETDEFFNFSLSQISWIISGFPLGVVLISLFLYSFYYKIGTKYSLLIASFFILLSWTMVPFGNSFEILLSARIIGGCGAGIIFILVPVYMKELMGHQINPQIIDILITQFGCGIFIQYFIGYITSLQALSVLSIGLSLFFFIICLLIPESPRYNAYCDLKYSYDLEKAVKPHNLWSEEDLQRKSILDLFVELKKLNLLSLIGLILFEQFIGGISILFYMKHFAQLTGGEDFMDGQMMAIFVGLTLIMTIPLSKVLKFPSIKSIKTQLVISTVAVILCMLMLAIFCHTEGSLGHKLDNMRWIPLLSFVIMTFFSVAGITRNSLLILQQILQSYSLQLHLKTFAIFVTWFFIFGITKLLPQLLFFVGVGYFYCFMIVFTLIALIFICKIVPKTLNLEVDRATPTFMERSYTISTTSSVHQISTPPLSNSSSFNEIRIEHI